MKEAIKMSMRGRRFLISGILFFSLSTGVCCNSNKMRDGEFCATSYTVGNCSFLYFDNFNYEDTQHIQKLLEELDKFEKNNPDLIILDRDIKSNGVLIEHRSKKDIVNNIVDITTTLREKILEQLFGPDANE